MNYKEYIQSEGWQNRRRIVLEFWGYRCAICNSSEQLQVHHRTYANLGCEKLSDLIVLCDKCHAIHHANFTRPHLPEHISYVLQRIALQVANGGAHG